MNTDTQVDTQAHSSGCKHKDIARGHTYTHLHSHTHDTHNTLVGTDTLMDTDTFMNSHKHEHIYTVTLMDTDTWTRSWTHICGHIFMNTQTGGQNVHTDMLTDTPWWTHTLVDTAPALTCLPASLSTCLWIAVGQTDRPFSRGAGDGLAGDFSRPSDS